MSSMVVWLTITTLYLNIPTATSSSGVATTTRYWDCSGGACGCAYLPSHLGGDNAKPAHCYSNALFAAPTNNPWGATFYGSAAISQALGGGYWMSEGCGKCWKVTGQSNIPNYDTTTVTTLILKGTNFCPPVNSQCSGDKKHFDIAAPGFDWVGASLSNSCAEREPDQLNGFESCGTWMIDSSNPNENCNCNDFTNSILRDGCENFKGLHWDNPQVSYEEVECPMELQQLPCWEENGNGYPWPESPDLCMDPLAGNSNPSTPSPTTLPTPPPTGTTTSSPTTLSPTPPTTTTSPTTSPTPPPTGSTNNGCCSNNFKTCIEGWCNDYDRCGSSSSCPDYRWLENGELTGCIQRWTGGCNSDNDCCPGLYCDTTNPNWKSCQY